MSDSPSIEQRIKEVIEDFRPVTQTHGGDVEFVALSAEKVVQVRLQGACHGCPAATQTLRQGLEHVLRARVPEIAGVEQVA